MPALDVAHLTHLDAEKSVLGGILLHPVTYAEVSDLLHESDFQATPHKAIYAAMKALIEGQRPIDTLTVTEQLKTEETLHLLNAFEGVEYLQTLQLAVISVENIRHHATVVRNRAHRKRCFESLTELRAKAVSPVDDEEFIQGVERALMDMLTYRREDAGPREVKKILREVLTDLSERYEKNQRGETLDALGISTGYPKLDWFMSGWQAGLFYVVGGRPSMGKTAFLLNCLAVAGQAGAPGLVFSLEMQDRQLVHRILSAEARLDGKAMRRGEIDVRGWLALTRAAGDVSKYPVLVDETSALNWDTLCSRARRWRMKHERDDKGKFKRVGIIAIDYLQLIDGVGGEEEKGGKRAENRQQEITRISRGCKGLAKELQCAVIALSQLNRGLESRDDKRPKLSDLRESGAIEQDADVITFMYRDEVYHNPDRCDSDDPGNCERCQDNVGQAEVILGKQRDGDLGTVKMLWRAPYTRFEQLETRRDDGPGRGPGNGTDRRLPPEPREPGED